MGLDMYLSEIVETKDVAYWRKANAIHRWFVENVQDNNDNCGDYIVSAIKLNQLRSLCKEVLLLLNNSSVVEVEKPEQSFIVKNGKVEQCSGTCKTFEYDKKTISQIEDLLPSLGGFFFGDTSYGESYREDIVDTISMLDKILGTDDVDYNNAQNDRYFIYTSSW